ncbi:MAG: D-isomer specific 2-hydroxyacid dehydrogenase family protein [Nocardioidaceae bacterium]
MAQTRDATLVWVGPVDYPDVTAAVVRGGGTLTSLEDAKVIVWTGDGPSTASAELFHAGIEWVQVDSAGVDHWFASGLLDDRRLWSSARGRFGAAVGEQAVMLLLAACRRVVELARTKTWIVPDNELLAGKTVGIIGAGSIGRETIARLVPFGVTTLAVAAPGDPDSGADETFTPEQVDAVIERSDLIVLALPLMPSTRHLVNAERLKLLGPKGWVVNVSRGPVVDTEALVQALRDGTIAGACLDVTDPEPLPDGHPLWEMPNVLITCHSANTEQMLLDAYAQLVEENVRLFHQGEPLQGLIDLDRGY